MKTYNSLLRIILGIALVLLALLSVLPMIPPHAVAIDAPAEGFSAERAMADLQVVAKEPHAAGSEAQARVRQYIVDQLAVVGLQAVIETHGQVSNILVRLPGSDPTSTVLVSGHYDSHPPAPGAGDDGLSTVAMLESLRVLNAGSPLRNDVLFLFTDGEELGWLGAIAYMEIHPDARESTGAVFVFDGLPGNGPLSLRETSPGDGWLVREISGLSLPLWAGSWTNKAERAEFDTDFSLFSQAGYTGLEIESAEAGVRYHTAQDTADAISANLLQGFGQTMLALVQHFGSIDFSTRIATADVTYFSLPLVGLVYYPGWINPVLGGIGFLCLVTFVFVAWRKKQFTPGRFGWSLLGFLSGLVLILLLAQLAWSQVKHSHASEIAALGGFETSTAWLTGLMIIAMLMMLILLAFLSRRFGTANVLPPAALAYLLVWFSVHFLLGADDPLTTAYIALPLLGGVSGMGILLFVRHPIWKTGLLAVAACLVLVLTVPQLWLAAYTREDAWIPVLAACIPLGFFSPQLEAIFGRALERG
jgi:hypothetical protein